jgi:glycosyl hydrolase family 10
MGVLKFQLITPEVASRFTELRKAYITGLDRTPSRLGIEFRQGLMICHRDTNESGRLFVPWPVEGFGTPIVGTATLSERPEPYGLAVELARGRLNDLRNQLADWKQLGLRAPAELDGMMAAAHQAFFKAVTAGEDLDESFAAAQASLAAAYAAGNLLVEVYTNQVLQTRLASTPKLPTSFGCVLDGDPRQVPWAREWGGAFNAAQVCCTWRTLSPAEGRYHWEPLDAQVAWCRKHKVPLQAGPLLDFRPQALPDWIWLWEGDFDTLHGLIVDFVRQAVARYRGKVPLWHLVHRPACNDSLGLSEEEQIRITARAIQVARQADPSAQFTIGVDRPWAEWMGATTFQLGPLHLADYLVRADLGLAGLVLEVAPGYSSPGSHIRDLFDFSRLLDLFALLNLPLHIWFAMPSSAQPDPQADPAVRVETGQWPGPPDEMTQAEWGAKWAALAVAKPYVRSVTWLQPSDATPHLYPHAGLFRADQTSKPLFPWIKSFRLEVLA